MCTHLGTLDSRMVRLNKGARSGHQGGAAAKPATTASKPLDSSISKKDKKKIMKAGIKVKLMTGTGKNHSNLHKHARRSTRPVAAKSTKSARVATEKTTQSIATVATKIKILVDKLKLLEKLHTRQKSAGKPEAAETLNQLEALTNERLMLEAEAERLRASG